MGFAVYPLSEYAVSIDFGGDIDTETLRRVTGFDALLRKHPFSGLRNTAPAYSTLTVFFDPTTVIAAEGLPGLSAYERVHGYLVRLQVEFTDSQTFTGPVITIPVCYGGIFGPDLADIATYNGLSPQSVVELHCAVTYHVHFIGFTPGFAYLGGLPDRLSMPRKTNPRPRVSAGSVGIAGTQTGIYPLDTPGGWQLIGRTPWRLFDPCSASPTLLNAGDRVIFKQIPPERFATFPAPDEATNP